jgi:hypothetical protein
MPRLDISVYHDDKDQVKAMGAKWDVANRIWYVPDGVDPILFKQWFISDPSPINVRSTSFSIAVQKQNCWRCSAPTDMAAIVLPDGWEEWEIVEETEEGEEDNIMGWCSRQAPAAVHYIMLLSDTALSAIAALTTCPAGR